MRKKGRKQRCKNTLQYKEKKTTIFGEETSDSSYTNNGERGEATGGGGEGRGWGGGGGGGGGGGVGGGGGGGADKGGVGRGHYH